MTRANPSCWSLKKSEERLEWFALLAYKGGKAVKNLQKIHFFPSESLVFSRITSKSLTSLFFKEIKCNSLTVALFERSTRAISSGCSFLKRVTRSKRSQSLFFEDQQERKSEDQKIKWANYQLRETVISRYCTNGFFLLQI